MLDNTHSMGIHPLRNGMHRNVHAAYGLLVTRTPMAIVVLSGSSSFAHASLIDVTVEGGSWDSRGYVPFEATSPVAQGLAPGLRLLRQGRVREALPLLRAYSKNNPRDLAGIKTYVDALERVNAVRPPYDEYRKLVTVKQP